VLMSDVEQGADVRMIERRKRPRLAFEAVAELGIARERLGEDFDRDRPIQARVARAIHLTHAAGTEGPQHFVRTEAVASGQRHLLGNSTLWPLVADLRDRRVPSFRG
jgi:hypothetical protein